MGVQLRGGILPGLGWSQADLVLQLSSYLWSADGTTTPSRSLQLPRRIRKLAGGLVCGQEGLVLFEQRQGLPTGSWRLRLSLGLSSGRCMTFVLALEPSSGAMACFVASKSLLRIGHGTA